jgi:galacturan 1,4-alpha-galacturonidase
MDKLFIITLLGLLILVNGVAENLVFNNFAMLEELESFEIDDEDDVELFDIPSWTSERGGKVLVNVDSFGAVGDGISDDTQVHIRNLEIILKVFSTVSLTLMIDLSRLKSTF